MWTFTVSVIKVGIEILVCLFLLGLLLAPPAMLFDRWRSRRVKREMEEHRRKWQDKWQAEQRASALASFKRRYGLEPEHRKHSQSAEDCAHNAKK